MQEYTIDELVLVHLFEADAVESRTTAGICEAFGIGPSVSERVEILSALSSLQDRGHLVADDRAVDDRTVYSLTERGDATAAELRADLVDHSCELVDGGDVRTCSVEELRTDLDVASTAAVAYRSTGGRLRLDDVPEDAFVGREQELASIEEVLAAIENGERGTITVVGERGVGKTELLRRATERAEARGATVVSITCRSDPNEPFEPVQEALAAHGAADVFDRPPAAIDSAGGLATRRVDLFSDLVNAFESIGGPGRPTVVMVDDLHEAGDAVLEFLEFLTDRLPDGMLVIAATRPVDIGDGEADRNGPLSTVGSADAAIELGPLGRAETRELVVRLLGDRSVPSAVTDRLYERTGGVPLFVIELVARLRETGAIDPDAGVYPTDDTALPTPDDVSRAVKVRLGALDETARSVLDDAAVLGHTIDRDVLQAITDSPPAIVREYLDMLVETDFLDDTGTLQFLSEVTREVLLEELDEEWKRRRHRAIAEAYRDVRADPPHAAIARHYERAGMPELALEQYRKAGDQAIDVYAHEESLEHFERALSLARDLDAEDALIGIAESIGRVYYVTGEYDEADRYFEFLRERTDDPERIQRSYRYQTEMANDRGNLERAEEYAQAGIDAVAEPTLISCRLVGHRGWYQLQRGNLEAAEEWFQRQYDLAERLADEDRLAGAYHNLGMLAHHRGDLETAIEQLERAAELNERAGSARDIIASYNNLSIVYHTDGRIDDAIASLERARERAVEVGDRPTELLEQTNIAGYDHLRGDLDGALERAEGALDASRRMGLVAQEAVALHVIGSVLLDRCQFDAARERLEASADRHEDTDNARMITSIRGTLSALARYEDDLEEARDHADRAVAASEGTEPDLRAIAQYHLGDAERDAGDLDAAIEAYERALDAVDAGASPETTAEVQFRLGATRSERTDGESGLDLARAACEVADDLEAPLLRAEAYTGLARCHRAAGDYGAAAAALADAETAIEGIDAPLYACKIRVERALLAADRGDEDATRRLEATAAFVAEHGAALLARRCRDALE